MTQEITEISISKLVLWTENPRDRINTELSDQDIANRAISKDGRSRWALEKLFEKMGKRFDQSEIPTVCYIEGKPVVYDGNRRVLIGKLIHGHVQVSGCPDFSNFDFPDKIPCNVCDKKTALEHVDRKHADSGSWKPLERDIFKHIHMEEDKSAFLVIDEKTGVISNNPMLNQRFVKEEIFDKTTLHKLGFSVENDVLKHRYKNEGDGESVIEKIIELVKNKEVTTRKNRGEIENVLKKNKIIRLILARKKNKFTPVSEKFYQKTTSKKTAISFGKHHELFGKKRILQTGSVNNIYSDLLKLYKERDKKGYSQDFPALIRMGLRLLCEVAFDKDWDNFIKENFDDAKQKLKADEKNTLHTQNVAKTKIVSLLHSGAHDYTASNNLEQTVAISLIIGELLEYKHGKNP